MSLYQGNSQIGGQGRPGNAGKSAYEAAKEGGYTGTEAEFNEAMKLTPPHLSDKGNPHGVTAEQIGAAAANHTHTAGQISGLPTSLPASDVYPWAKQPNKPTYTANEVGAAGGNHNHDDRYYTEAEVNNLLTAIKNRLTKLEGSVDMAKLVYSTKCSAYLRGDAFTTYANADFVLVRAVGTYFQSNSSVGIGGVIASGDGVKIMKGCTGDALVWYRPDRGDTMLTSIEITYGTDGSIKTNANSTNTHVTFNLEFYKQ